MTSTDIDRHRERLFALRGRLRAGIAELEEAIAGDGNDPGDLSHVPTHVADRDMEELEVDEAMDRNQVALLGAVEDALERMEAGTFGRCEECGGEIPERRLEALPYAALCLACQRGREAGPPEAPR
jgi:phage/conjugal plasmid C-4 type zinc finger TraR family protein